MNNLKTKLSVVGLVSLIASANLPSIKGEQIPRSPVFQAYSSQQSGNNEMYTVRFVESERFYYRDSDGKLKVMEQKDYDPLHPNDPVVLVGDLETIQQHYKSFKQRGNVPDLGYLDRALENIVADMAKDSLSLSREFSPKITQLDGNKNFILAGNKKMEIDGMNYNVLINAKGKIVDGNVQVDYLMSCQITSENNLVLRQVGKTVDRWYSVEDIGNNQIRQKRAAFDWNPAYELDSTGVRRRLLDAIRYQQINVPDIK